MVGGGKREKVFVPLCGDCLLFLDLQNKTHHYWKVRMNFFTVKFTQILFGFRFGGVSEKALLFSIRSFASKKQIEKTNFLFSSLSLRERRMGSSSSKKKQPRNRPQDLKLMVVGDRAVGKTSLLFTSITNDFPEEHIPTVFDNYSTNCFYQNTQFEIGLWGSFSFSSNHSCYFSLSLILTLIPQTQLETKSMTAFVLFHTQEQIYFFCVIQLKIHVLLKTSKQNGSQRFTNTVPPIHHLLLLG